MEKSQNMKSSYIFLKTDLSHLEEKNARLIPGPGSYNIQIPTKSKIHFSQLDRFKNSNSTSGILKLGPGAYFKEDIKQKVLSRYQPQTNVKF